MPSARRHAAAPNREYSWGTAMRGLLGLYRGALVSGSESAPGYATS